VRRERHGKPLPGTIGRRQPLPRSPTDLRRSGARTASIFIACAEAWPLNPSNAPAHSSAIFPRKSVSLIFLHDHSRAHDAAEAVLPRQLAKLAALHFERRCFYGPQWQQEGCPAFRYGVQYEGNSFAARGSNQPDAPSAAIGHHFTVSSMARAEPRRSAVCEPFGPHRPK
jgi:hypothetical protein